MLTLLTALGSVALSILTLPIKSVKFLKKASGTNKKKANDISKDNGDKKSKGGFFKKRDTALSRIKEKRNGKSDLKKKVTSKLAKKGIKTAVVACITFLRSVLMIIASFSSIMALPMVMTLVIALAIIGGISGSISGSKGVNVTHVYDGNDAVVSDSDKPANKPVVGTWTVNQSASTSQILAMNTDQIWEYISEGKYTTKDAARADAKANYNECKEFWESMYYTIEVPVWVWGDAEKQTIVASTKKITCNRNLAVFWTDFFTDLYNCSDQYVMNEILNPVWRWVSGMEGVAVSMHSYGIAFDINPSTKHDGDSFMPMALYSPPYSSPDKLPYDEWRHTVCTFSSSWLEVAKSYKLSWGGTWSSRHDNMHFSMPGGDTDLDKTVYINQIGKYADGGG